MSVRGRLVQATRQTQRAIGERWSSAGARAVTVLLPVDRASAPIARAPSTVPATATATAVRRIPVRDAERQEGTRA